MRRLSAKRLREVYWRSCRHEGYLNIYVYRRISIWFAAAATRLRLSPNQVTSSSLVLNILTAIMFVPGNHALALWALVPFHAGKILDCADGQLASLTEKKSALGAFLDPFFDRISDVLILMGLAIGYQMSNDSSMAIYIVLVMIAAWFFGAYLDSYTNEPPMQTLRQTQKSRNPVIARLLKWDGGFTGLITTLAVVFNAIPWLVGLFAIIALLPLPLQFTRIYARLREEHA